MNKLKIWIDDMCPAPVGWKHIHSVDEMLKFWDNDPNFDIYIDTISFDHDAGDFYKYGGDYIKILDFMDMQFNSLFKDHGWNYDIKYHLHSGNPVGVMKMRNIIQKNGWKEIEEI